MGDQGKVLSDPTYSYQSTLTPLILYFVVNVNTPSQSSAGGLALKYFILSI